MLLNSKTLSLYIIKLYLYYFIFISFIVFGIFLIGNLFDTFTIFKGVYIPNYILWRLVICKAPYLYNNASVLISFAAMLFLFRRITSSNELVIILCNGISVRRLLILICFIAVIISLFLNTVVDPIGAYGLEKYGQLTAKVKGKKKNEVTLLNSGILLHEEYDQEHRIIKTKSINILEHKLKDVTILFFDIKTGAFLKRLDADYATIQNNNIKFQNPKVVIGTNIDKPNALDIPTTLSVDNLTNILKDPEEMSIFMLRKAINKLLSYGLPVITYQIYYYKQLLKPVLMLTTICLAGIFFNITNYRYSSNKLLFSGLITGLVFYLVLEIVIKILSFNGISPILAILIPNLLVLFISNFIILHLHEA